MRQMNNSSGIETVRAAAKRLMGRLASIFFLICCLSGVKAADITPKKALDIAKKYVTLSSKQTTRAALRRAAGSAVAPFYIFNDAEGKGYVVVSGNDEMGEVLAYSTSETLDTLTANPGVRLLLAGYRQTFELLKQTGRSSAVRPQVFSASKTVSPLLKSKWGQSAPYNAKTGYRYSGCVATAVAQVMYYHQWPAQGRGKNEYIVSYDNKQKSADFSLSRYDWASMLPNYDYPVTATAAEQDAVALLMSDVGIAVSMQYTPWASGAYSTSACNALENNFDYSAALVSRSLEGMTRFAEIIRQELLDGCPVYLSGNPSGGGSGHAWVTDGFDQNGLFHMNFGWNGQSDGFYSLAALSVSQTGNEFQGKALTFGSGLQAIVAHPNNSAYPPIDRALLNTSPQLTFNESGALILPEGSADTFDTTQMVTVEMTSFVNRGRPFKGDVGVAVFDSDDGFCRIFYSDDHADGGFTQREYGARDGGVMGSDFLMDRPQSVKVNLSGLADGYYRLVPVCAEWKDDGSWDEWLRMRKAPVMEIELEGGRRRVSEEARPQAGFQLMAQPVLSGKVEQGGTATAVFTLKNLTGVSRDCFVKMRLCDENDKPVFETRNNTLTEFDSFFEAKTYIALSLPADIAPGRYKVWLEMIGNDGKGGIDNEQATRYKVNPIHNKETAYITVQTASEKPLMANVQVFLADDSDDRIESNELILSSRRNFKLAASLRTSENRTYEGTVTFYCEDVETKTRTKLNSPTTVVTLRPNLDVPVYTYWLMTNSLPIDKGRTYRVMVMGSIEGQEVELKADDQPDYFLTVKDNTLRLHTDLSTDIASVGTPTTEPSVTHEGDRLVVSGSRLCAVSIFTANGTLVQRLQVHGDNRVIVPLHAFVKGLYVVQVQCGNAVKVVKMQVN